jgi:hypothetical protein
MVRPAGRLGAFQKSRNQQKQILIVEMNIQPIHVHTTPFKGGSFM